MKTIRILVCITLLLSALADGLPLDVQANVGVPGFALMAENEHLALYFNEDNASVAVAVKTSGTVWYSNPPDWQGDERVAGTNREFMQSMLRISYYNAALQELTMNSFFDAVGLNQVEVEPLPDGIKLTYTLGDTGDRMVIPRIISKERLESFSGEMSAREWTQVMRRYLDEGDVYVLRENQGDFALSQLSDVLEKAGYTKEDMAFDHEANGVPEPEANVHFIIPIVYKLEDATLLAYIPTEEIVYPEDFPLARISMLEFFGAAGLDSDGYILVPDGAGALIRLNNGRTSDQQYIARVYGLDRTFDAAVLPPQPEHPRLPVFGIQKDGAAMFAIIEDGDAFAVINTRVSGVINSYNTVWADFLVKPFDMLQLAHMGENRLLVFQDEIFQGSCKIRYAFLDGDDADYSGMARFYQNYLVERGILAKRQTADKLPFIVEAIGAIQRTKNFMGIPYEGTVPLTTFDQAIIIMDELRNNGINNIVLTYSGWLNGGMFQRSATEFNIVSQLGGKKGFERLLDYVNARSISFYPEVQFNYAYPAKFFTGLTDGFTVSSHVSRTLENTIARRSNYHMVTYENTDIAWTDVSEPTPYIVKPSFLGNMVSKFLNRFNSFDTTGIATGSLYTELNSAYNRGDTTDRQRAIDRVVEAGALMLESGHRQLADSANAYGFTGLDYITNVPFSHSGFMVAEESVPFYQMVVRGYIEYTGTPINTASDIRYHLLKTLETGSGLYVEWMHEQNSIVRDTYFTELYSHNYIRSMGKAVDMYREAAAVLDAVQGQRIIKHEILPCGLRQVTYENGMAVLLNFTQNQLSYGAFTVDAMSYAVSGN